MRQVFAAFIVLFACNAAACADERDGAVYDREVDAAAQIETALREADQRGVNALLVFGANWCHDSRGLAHALASDAALSAYLGEHFVTGFVDIGTRDRNLDQLARFGVEDVFGTPTVLIVDGQGQLLNRSSVHNWRTAHDVPLAEIAAYLARFADAPSPIEHTAFADLDFAVVAWPPFASAVSDLEDRIAAGEITQDEAERIQLYLDGLAMSVARRALGQVASDQGLAAIDSFDLGGDPERAVQDITEAVIARMADTEMDMLERAAREMNDHGQTR